MDPFLLDEYEVARETAFVPANPPPTSLPPQFQLFEDLVSNPPLHEAISSLEIRTKVDKLPKYPSEFFEVLSTAEKRRLMVILAFTAHGYIWGNGHQILDRLPSQIAVPLDFLSKALGTVPLGTYATTVLWNSRLKDPDAGWSLDNVSIDFTFTGTKDESWFYTVSVCIEVAGAQALWSLQCILHEITKDSPSLCLIREHFAKTLASLEHMQSLLKEADKMDSKLFYWTIRVYFAGSRNVHPDGVLYEGVDDVSTRRSYVGISAAQSSLFSLDIISSISHEAPGATYLHKMLSYMPLAHAKFLTALRAQPADRLKNFVRKYEDLTDMFDRCLRSRAQFRALHLKQAQKYAVDEASRKGQHAFGLAKPATAGGGVQGAGSTPIRLFLNSTLIKTNEAKISGDRGVDRGVDSPTARE